MSRWGKQEGDHPMTDAEAAKFKAWFDAEVTRLSGLPKTHRDFFVPRGGLKASPEQVRYLEWLERKRQEARELEESLDPMFR